MSNFETITNISQFDSIQNKQEINFKEVGDLTVVFYSVALCHTFDEPLTTECRGIVFNTKTGDVVARPLHKFFNLNERNETQQHNIDFTKPHTFFDKRDGSMVFPVMLNGGQRLFTKGGQSDVAIEAERLAWTDNVKKFNEHMEHINYTPVFEYTGSPKHAIVLRYPKPELVLLAAREKNTGEYMDYTKLTALSIRHNIRIVDVSSNININSAVENSKVLEDIEGYVCRFDDTGLTVKVKTEWYVKIHSMVSGVSSLRRIAVLVMDNTMDDTIPLLPEQIVTEILPKIEIFSASIIALSKRIDDDVTFIKTSLGPDHQRKEFAELIKGHVHSDLMFKRYAGANSINIVRDWVIKNSITNRSFRAVEGLFNKNYVTDTAVIFRKP